MASNLLAMASNLVPMASNLLVMASNLVAMASNLVAMASNLRLKVRFFSRIWMKPLPGMLLVLLLFGVLFAGFFQPIRPR